jgi:hypothetical protein
VQFSLNAFVTVFSRGLDNAPGGRKSKRAAQQAAAAVTLRQLSRRLSNTQPKDFQEVIQVGGGERGSPVVRVNCQQIVRSSCSAHWLTALCLR